MNGLNNVAPITTVERNERIRRQLRLFRAWQKFLKTSSSCALSATAMLRYTICRRVLETFNDGGIALR